MSAPLASRYSLFEGKWTGRKGWNPPGKRKQGRSKMTLRKTFEGDLKKMELTLGTAERKAKERISWRKVCTALSSMDRRNERLCIV